MKPRIHVVDYGLGNLLSVVKALEHCGAEAVLTDRPTDVEGAERLVLPGVGAFSDGMAGLRSRGLVEALKVYADKGRPLLGICLGMQLFMQKSHEFGTHEGLGLIAGEVVAIPTDAGAGKKRKVPHIGWNQLRLSAGRHDWKDSCLADVPTGASVYFVHSYGVSPKDPTEALADAQYDGCTISAAVQKGAIVGCQFHPEKSGPVGLGILKSFLES